MQAIHDASKSKLEKLTERVKSQDKTLSLLESHLNTSKQREDALERSIKDIASQNETKRREKGEGLPTANEDEEEGVVHESSTSNQMFAQLYANSQARCKELEAELADAKANMDELIVEIEAVATEEEKTRTQNARLLKQLTEGHNVHKGVLQENLRLHQDIITLQEKEALANTKYVIFLPSQTCPHLSTTL